MRGSPPVKFLLSDWNLTLIELLVVRVWAHCHISQPLVGEPLCLCQNVPIMVVDESLSEIVFVQSILTYKPRPHDSSLFGFVMIILSLEVTCEEAAAA